MAEIWGDNPSISLNPRVLRGKTVMSTLASRSLPSVATHEGQHFLTSGLFDELLHSASPKDMVENILKMDKWTQRIKPHLKDWKLRPDAIEYIENTAASGTPIRAFDEAVSLAAEAIADKQFPKQTKDILAAMMGEWFK